MSVAFLVTTLVVVATPGAGALFTIGVDDSAGGRSAWRTIRSAVLVNLLNPRLTIFFAAAMRTRVLQRPRVLRWLRRSFAGSYVVLAGRLAVAER